jgi:hypothetical protein
VGSEMCIRDRSTTVHAPGSNIIAPSYGYAVADPTLTGKHNRGKS